MRYREARLLIQGDQILVKETLTVHVVQSIEVYGKDKPIRINCQDNNCFWHTEVGRYERV